VSVRFGLLGTGYWADTIHGAGLAAHPGAELVGVWGRDVAKAAAVAERHGVEAFAELEGLLASVEAVSIAVAPDAQAELAVRAARSGCHLLLEKPLATTTEAADRVAAAVEAAHVASVVFFTARFAPPSAAWFRDVVSRGAWDGARVAILASIFEEGSPYADSAWRRERGALWDIGPHALAGVLPALGPVTDVEAVRGRGDTVVLALRHRAGGASALTLSLTVPAAAGHDERVLWGPAGVSRMPQATNGLADVAEGYAAAVRELTGLIRAGLSEHDCDVRLGREIVHVLAAAESHLERSRRPESL
jgi:predicted dehydrogenase